MLILDPSRITGWALIGALAWSSAAQGGTIAVASPPNYAESLVPAGEWKGVAQVITFGNCSGVLISPQHVLTAAHCFFFDPADGAGTGTKFDTRFVRIVFPEVPQRVFGALMVQFAPGYDPTPGTGGHRRKGNDLAIITLDAAVPGATVYPINTGQIPDETYPFQETIKVGFGRGGNGETGANSASGEKRFLHNRVDEFGDGMTTWHRPFAGSRDEPPPNNTLVYDFDTLNGPDASLLRNRWRDDDEYNGAVDATEGSPASGDSGGPMFMRIAPDDPWVVVGITSSGSDSRSRFGTVAYDTRVQAYSDWITATIAVPECSTFILGTIGAVSLAAFRFLTSRVVASHDLTRAVAGAYRV